MQILEYDQVDPMAVLHLNEVSLGYYLTPERVELIRRLDTRPFPFFAIYAVEGSRVIGQVGVFRLTMTSINGREEVGGVWAVCTDPGFSRRGVASTLLREAHERMRSAGLSFSTLGTSRAFVAHSLYKRHRYIDVHSAVSTIMVFKKPARDNPLRVEQAGVDRLNFADKLHNEIGEGKLGFTQRQKGFLSMLVETGELQPEEVWLIWEADTLAGFAIARPSPWRMLVSNLLVRKGVEVELVLEALAQETSAIYLRAILNEDSQVKDLAQAGHDVPREPWGIFMMKGLHESANLDQIQSLFGAGTDRFMISWMDTT